jgi:large subunit ribosomal protein L10e
MYRYITQHSYTRRKYTGGVPPSRLLQFKSGTDQDYPIIMELVVNERTQIRSQALEAARIAAGRFLDKRVGRSNFFFKIRVFPHEILRENKQATGAGADRVSQGMRNAFGGNIGVAARVDRDQAILELRTTQIFVAACKEALRKASMKIAPPCRIEYVKGRDLALSAPSTSPKRRLTAEEKLAKKAEDEAEEAAAEATEGEEGAAEGGEKEEGDAKKKKGEEGDAKKKKGEDAEA